MSDNATRAEAAAVRYGEAYERVLVADEAFRKAGAAQTKAMHELRDAEQAWKKWYAEFAATIRVAVKEKHPEIDPTRSIGLDGFASPEEDA